MPFRSTAQQKWAFATDQPFARRWAHETDFGSLPKRVRLKLRRQKISAKAWSDAARAAALAKRRANAAHTSDQRNLDQARHDAQQLRSRHVAHPSVPKPPKGRGGAKKKPAAGRKPAAPKKTDAQRLSEQQAREQRSEARYQQHAEEREQRYQAHRQQIEADRQKREAERRAAQQQKPKKGGGGGKKKGPKEQTPEQQAREQQRQERQRMLDARRERLDAERRRRQEQQDQARQQQAVERTRVTTPILAGLARQLSDGKRPLDAAQRGSLIRNGLAKVGKDGTLMLTSLGQRALRQKAETYGGVRRSDLEDSVFAGPDRSFPIKTAQDVRDAVRSLGRTKHDKAAVKKGIIRRARAIGATDALPESWRTGAKQAASSFTVFKDAGGQWRWVSVSSSAYRDRDGEIVSTKALENAVAIADATGFRGPLRWWHCGQPFGPGLDLGACDFQAVHGRFLIESGTFKSEAIALAFKDATDEVSIGFTHGEDAPNAAKIFDDVPIVIFERSLAPVGRVSNLFTQFTTTKETRMDDAKLAALKERVGPDLLAQLLGTVETKDKAAQAAKIAYKADGSPDLDSVVAALQADPQLLAAAVKAMGAPPMDEAADEKADEPIQDTEEQYNDMGDEGEPDGDENMLTPAECQQIAETVAQHVLAQLAPMLDLEKKMAAHADALKGAMSTQLGQYTAKKDAEAAETKQTIADLQTRLKEAQDRLATLEGDAPRGVKAGFKASEAKETVVTEADPRYKEQPKADPLDSFIGGFILNNGAPPNPGQQAA